MRSGVDPPRATRSPPVCRPGASPRHAEKIRELLAVGIEVFRGRELPGEHAVGIRRRCRFDRPDDSRDRATASLEDYLAALLDVPQETRQVGLRFMNPNAVDTLAHLISLTDLVC